MEGYFPYLLCVVHSNSNVYESVSIFTSISHGNVLGVSAGFDLLFQSAVSDSVREINNAAWNK